MPPAGIGTALENFNRWDTVSDPDSEIVIISDNVLQFNGLDTDVSNKYFMDDKGFEYQPDNPVLNQSFDLTISGHSGGVFTLYLAGLAQAAGDFNGLQASLDDYLGLKLTLQDERVLLGVVGLNRGVVINGGSPVTIDIGVTRYINFYIDIIPVTPVYVLEVYSDPERLNLVGTDGLITLLGFDWRFATALMGNGGGSAGPQVSGIFGNYNLNIPYREYLHRSYHFTGVN